MALGRGEKFKMKTRLRQALALLGLTSVSLAANIDKANAVTCARGVYRAGCVGPYDAVGVRDRSLLPWACVWRGGARVCR
jgi:hypothetical protein